MFSLSSHWICQNYEISTGSIWRFGSCGQYLRSLNVMHSLTDSFCHQLLCASWSGWAVCPGRPVCRWAQLFYTGFISLHQDTLNSSLFEVIMTCSTCLDIFLHHFPSAIPKRPNMQEQQFSKGHCCFTQHVVHWPSVYLCLCACGKNIMYKTENNTCAVGKSLMRNSLVRGCLFLY